MAQALYHAYSPSFTMAAASTTLPAMIVANTDTLHATSLKKYRIAMSGTGSASVLCQLFSTNTAATATGTSTAATLSQAGGRVISSGDYLTNCNYTAARTTETYIILDEFYLVNNQTVIYDYPPGDEPDCPIGVSTYGSGFGLFLASGTPVATSVDMWFTRI